MKEKKYIYRFGNKFAEGNASMKNLLGGKGANLAEMNLFGIPVPPGFTISTEACNHYYKKGKAVILEILKVQMQEGVEFVEEVTGRKFGDDTNPLLLSVRSGARVSMPGMMDTVLNLGLNDTSVEGFAKLTNNPRLAWDSYRRFIQMYGNVVMGMKPESKEEMDPFEAIMDEYKEGLGIENDLHFTTDNLKELTVRFRNVIQKRLGHEFPQDPWQQLSNAVTAVFDSWMNERAIHYRAMNGYPSDWGTAVNVQAMVFGNTGNNSATGVAFTRDPATGENQFTGEYLVNAQGEDVVAGIRTPQQVTKVGSQRWAKLTQISEEERAANFPSLEELMPEVYKELNENQQKLEEHYRDMQDLEFTIEEGKLWILQTRNGKRTGKSMIKTGMDMLREGIINEQEAILRMEPNKLDELLHPVFDKEALNNANEIAKGLPASPGATTGQIVFSSEDAESWANKGKDTILVRIETSPEDIKGMEVARGILTQRGGMTSHAAVVARGMGKSCVSGAGSLHIDYKARTLSVDGHVLNEGDWISINGSTGQVFEGEVDTVEGLLDEDYFELLSMSDKHARLTVRTNADTPKDASQAREFGAKGIGLCRTEHMFFAPERILVVRQMILADTEEDRVKALNKLLPFQRKDFEEIFEAMAGHPVTIRLLDPPLHEFLPHTEDAVKEVAQDLGVAPKVIQDKINDLHETNPMLGHRGCRLANTFPEISAMQARAIIDAALNCIERGIDAKPEIMVPLVSVGNELVMQLNRIRRVAETVYKEHGQRLNVKMGTMIEVPRAAIVSDRIAKCADFFSFGTNDLTQMTFGFSRDDIGKFLPIYLEKGILDKDPFSSIDQFGVGELVKMGVQKGKAVNEKLHAGVCGEHGGDPESIEFFHRNGLDYVSCSPFRVPLARLVAAQAAIKEKLHLEIERKDLVDAC